MKFIFLTVGKENKDIFQEAVAEYTTRLGRYFPVEWKYVKASPSGGDRAKTEEAESIVKQIMSGDYIILLDERGKQLTTKELSVFLDTKIQTGVKRIIFIIGGAYGVHESVRQISQTVLGLSSLTFPHELVRLVLAEQVYRACTILRGEKYHHE